MFLKGSTVRFFCTILLAAFYAQASASTVEDLRKEVEAIRKQLNEKEKTASTARIERIEESRYGPNAPVQTKDGKLRVGGLLKLWEIGYFGDHRNHQDVFGDRGSQAGTGGTDETQRNGTRWVRYSQLRFSLDIHENITSVVMIDPANEATSLPGFPDNQGLFKSQRTNPSIAQGADPSKTANNPVGRIQTGSGNVPRMLQDAYINYHGVVPHHDFTVGQFRPAMGEEGVRDDAFLDFAERAMVTQLNAIRDLGVQAHGTWLDDRAQYWVGAFDGAGNFFDTTSKEGPLLGVPQGTANRTDDNNDKDILVSALGRPFWNWGCWGSSEIGGSAQFGRHGESGDLSSDFSAPVNGLDRRKTAASRLAAWAYYKPMGVVRGWWLRGEWGYQKDRTVPLSVNAFALGSGPNGEQAGPHPFSRQGFYVGTGYKLSDSIFADRLSQGGFWNNLMQPVEFVFRYEQFGNIITEDLVNPDIHTWVMNSKVWTAGVNYYVKAYNMRAQLQFMSVDEPDNQARNLHDPKNNVLISTLQVYF
jgi:hypothetical protein